MVDYKKKYFYNKLSNILTFLYKGVFGVIRVKVVSQSFMEV